MATRSNFQLLFFGIVGIFALAFAMLALGICRESFILGHGLPVLDRGVPLVFPMLLVATIYVAIISVLVHKDATKRGMNPWLWATVAAFTPYLVGVIIYLVVRSTSKATCGQCGASRPAQLNVCPFCGAQQQPTCGQCGKQVDSDWKVCPYCRQQLVAELPEA